MDQKQVWLSALGIGVGVGAGLGLSSMHGGNNGKSSEEELWNKQVEQDLLRQVIEGKECNETFQDFPYYLSERTRELLMNAAFVHLKGLHFSRHIRNLPPASRTILLSGPAELYLQTIAKALAHHFGSKLLLLDIVDFSFKMKRKYGCARTESSSKTSSSEVASKRLASLFGSFWTSKTEVPDPKKNKSNMCIDEEFFMQLLYKVLVSVSEKSSIILYIRDVDKIFLESEQLYNLFHEIEEKLSGPILILGSQIIDVQDECSEEDLLLNGWLPCYAPEPGAEVGERLAASFPYNIKTKPLNALFSYNIKTKPPKDENNLQNWKTQLKENNKTTQSQDNQNHIYKALAEIDVECKDLNLISHEDTEILSKNIEEIVVSAVSYYLMNTRDPEYHNGKLAISSESMCHGLDLFRKTDSAKDTQKPGTERNNEVSPDNEYEENMRSELIPANEIGVTFSDIGALEEVKESLQELIMLPLLRPELFKSKLLKPCRGILLFGPPGTGKTMLAKAIAREAGASFINVPMSSITSRWYGEDEKNVRALFTLAAKVSPTVIFIDEVDSLLGQRSRCGEHEATRRIKNEFMTHWDGLLTKQDERILVLAATNRPFDLDDAIIRRFQRRIMVGLPTAETREIILKTILDEEKTENLDFEELAIMTEGYTGSDLKNLCTAAAYRPVRELIKQERLSQRLSSVVARELDSPPPCLGFEPCPPPPCPGFEPCPPPLLPVSKEKKKQDRLKDMEKSKKEAEGQSSEAAMKTKEDTKEREKSKNDAEDQSSEAASSAEDKEDSVITLRPINMEDMIEAKKQVPASFDADGLTMLELKEWNELYGERGLR